MRIENAQITRITQMEYVVRPATALISCIYSEKLQLVSFKKIFTYFDPKRMSYRNISQRTQYVCKHISKQHTHELNSEHKLSMPNFFLPFSCSYFSRSITTKYGIIGDGVCDVRVQNIEIVVATMTAPGTSTIIVLSFRTHVGKLDENKNSFCQSC